jgi:hypothetical protein
MKGLLMRTKLLIGLTIAAELARPAIVAPQASGAAWAAAPAACVKMTLRDNAYAFKLKVATTTGYFKVNVGSGTTHGGCPDWRVDFIGHRIVTGDSTKFSSIRYEACFVIAEGGAAQPFAAEWDVVVPFMPDSGLELPVDIGGQGIVDVTISDLAGQEKLRQTFTKDGTLKAAKAALPAPGGLKTVIPAKPALAPKMGAFYFPWYGTADGPTGALRHWDAGDILFTPALGHYDSGDTAIIRQQMQWARRANLNLFVVSYWDQEYSNQNLGKILDGAAANGMEISAMIETTVRRAGTPRENFLAQVQEILKTYAKHPAWLKAEGRPILFVYDRVKNEMYDASPTGWWSDWLWVKSQVDSNLIIMFPIDDSTQPDQVKAMGGGFAFAANSGAGNPWIGSHDVDWSWTWTASQVGGLSALPILPRFKTLGVPSDVPNYKNQWRAARASMPDIILVNSWNEYHESSIIEPTAEFGTKWLDLSAVEAAKFCAGEMGNLAADSDTGFSVALRGGDVQTRWPGASAAQGTGFQASAFWGRYYYDLAGRRLLPRRN